MDGRARSLLVGLTALVVGVASLGVWVAVGGPSPDSHTDTPPHASVEHASAEHAATVSAEGATPESREPGEAEGADDAPGSEARTTARPTRPSARGPRRRTRHESGRTDSTSEASTEARPDERTTDADANGETTGAGAIATAEFVAEGSTPQTPEQQSESVLVTGTVRSEERGVELAEAIVEVRKWYAAVKGPTLQRGDGSGDFAVRERIHANGSFYVDRPEGGEKVVITFEARGHVPHVIEVDPEHVVEPPLELSVTLERSGFLSGIVRDHAGEPAYHAHVHAIEADALPVTSDPELTLAIRRLLWGHGRFDEDTHYRRDFARTNAAGHFVHYGVRRNKRYVLVAVTVDEGWSLPSRPVFSGTDPSHTNVELSLREPVPVSIDYLDAAGRRRSDASIRVRAAPHAGIQLWRRLWSTNSAGHVVHPAFLPGPQWIEIDLPNTPDDRQLIDVQPGRHNHFVLRAPSGRTIDVTATDGQGRPLRGVRVHCFARSLESPRAYRSSLEDTDEHGRVAFEGVPTAEVKISGTKDGYVEAEYEVAPGGSTRVRLLLHPARTLVLDVTPAPGEARASELQYAYRRAGRPEEEWITDEGDWGGDPVRVTGVPIDAVELRVWAPGHSEAAHIVERTQLGVAAHVELQLESAPRRRIRLVDPTGTPLGDAEFDAFFADDRRPLGPTFETLRTDADGLVTLALAGDGPVSVFLTNDDGDFELISIEPSPGAAPIDVQFPGE